MMKDSNNGITMKIYSNNNDMVMTMKVRYSDELL